MTARTDALADLRGLVTAERETPPVDGVQVEGRIREGRAARRIRGRVNAVVPAEAVWGLAHPLRQRKAVIATVIGRRLDAASITIDPRRAVESALSAWRDGTVDLDDHLIGAIDRAAGSGTTPTFDRKAAGADTFTHLGAEP